MALLNGCEVQIDTGIEQMSGRISVMANYPHTHKDIHIH